MNQANFKPESAKGDGLKRDSVFGLRKVKRFFNLNKVDGTVSSQDDNCKSGTDSDYMLPGKQLT